MGIGSKEGGRRNEISRADRECKRWAAALSNNRALPARRPRSVVKLHNQMDLFGHLAEGVNTAPEAHYPFLEEQVEAVTGIFIEEDVLFAVAEQV